jgi:arylsulfatase
MCFRAVVEAGPSAILLVDGHGELDPITLPEDKTFDIGSDTRTEVALFEYRYDSLFRFTRVC